jgi:hypothetical protein
MSSLAETYALQVGVPLNRPEILEKFYPLDVDYSKTVLLHASAGNNNFPAKIYDYFNDVISLIKPELDKAGYHLIQIGGPNEQPVKNVRYLCGQTNIAQTAFLLKKCALFIGNDSMNAHIAGVLDVPSVVVYGPTDGINHGPYWKNEKTVLIQSHRFGNKRPSYSPQENPKTINQIPPEQIANEALKILNLPACNQKSYFFGEYYMQTVLDVCPDITINPDFAKEAPLNLRMDYVHDEKFLIENLKLRKCSIVIDRPINLDIFKTYKQNIISIRCKINPDFPKWVIKEIKKLGIGHVFYTENLTDEVVAKMRLDFFDVCFFDNFHDDTKEQFENGVKRFLNKKLDESINYDKLWYRSNKYLLSAKGTFLSKAAYDANQPIQNLDENIQKISDSSEFWKEQRHFYIFSKE